MKLLTTIIATLTLVCGSAAAVAGGYGPDDGFAERFANQNCSWCHGGASLQGFTTAPRLAGQRPEYLVKELLSFKHHQRDNPLSQQVMWGAVGRVDGQVAQVVAAYISSLPPLPAEDGYASLRPAGAAMYTAGAPASNVPACVVCHGPDGQGVGAIPRIGGLSYRYLERQLDEWGQGYHASAAFPMKAVATQLSEDQIEALASYLSFVR